MAFQSTQLSPPQARAACAQLAIITHRPLRRRDLDAWGGGRLHPRAIYLCPCPPEPPCSPGLLL
eukprot:4422683-Pyramimonas_sp.AAC.1